MNQFPMGVAVEPSEHYYAVMGIGCNECSIPSLAYYIGPNKELARQTLEGVAIEENKKVVEGPTYKDDGSPTCLAHIPGNSWVVELHEFAIVKIQLATTSAGPADTLDSDPPLESDR